MNLVHVAQVIQNAYREVLAKTPESKAVVLDREAIEKQVVFQTIKHLKGRANPDVIKQMVHWESSVVEREGHILL